MNPIEEIKTYAFNPLPVEIEVKDLAFIRQVPHIVGQPHKAQFYQIIWVKTGSLTCYIDFEPITIDANQLLIIAAGQICEFDVTSTYTGQLVLFTSSFFTRTEEDANFLHTAEILSLVSTNKIVSVSACIIEHLFVLLEKELANKTDSFQLAIAQNYLRIVLLEAERQVKPAPTLTTNTITQDFYKAIETYFKENRNINYYAELLGVSEKKLTQEVKHSTGLTPKVCLDARVILEAKRLLSYSVLSSKELSFTLGFDEPTNFIKYFRKHTNLTPQAFRDNQRKKNQR
ncbi:AraC family transcriptional activator of pobA [Myroides gitamensis]|uniref:helix-turn-helix domain-containing protein n=1 Tax=Myroides odoratus TaxID=256 RepID=UPI0021695E28|nr:helix-turn-helix domain-containing protein [Myroides odoratus]MCS4238586.1 AraC-like DNA-binding protein [Myroides odoratus]MDH6600481.1 AraC family transcriptional activator of pobA [Myroides gitamensis]